jgi:two-component system, chemotaxis family, sensor kinase CheA
MFDDSIDPNILLEFIDESIDSLEELPQFFIQMEKEPHNSEIVNAIFRPVHSIKGNSAFFGLLKLKKLTHELETTLDKCRKGDIIANKETIDILLKGLDEVTAIFNRIREHNPEVEDENSYNELLAEIVTSQSQEIHSDDNGSRDQVLNKLLAIDQSNILNGSLEESLLKDAISLLTDSTDNPQENTLEDSELSPYNSLVNFLQQDIDDALEEADVIDFEQKLLRFKDTLSDDQQLLLFDKVYDDFKTFSSTVGFDGLLAELLNEKISAIHELAPSNIPVEDEPLTDTIVEVPEVLEVLEVAEKEKIKTAAQLPDENSSNAAKTMRVPEDTIDAFLNFVGELIVVREMYDHLRLHYEQEGIAPELTTELRRHTDNFRQVSGELERTCMNIRKQPIKQILRKLPRIVRDVANSSGKEIEVIITGDDIQVDKSLIGVIEDPLVHMMRNSADHGIELPEDRLESGKDRKGKIHLKVVDDDENLYLSIIDDGKGLDYKRLLEKGIESGHFTESQNPSNQEIAQMIFMSGVSTAKEITDISGRGVGMDVVKKYIESAGGTVTIDSETGKGSEFKITLRKSVTTQIIDGLVFRLADTCYVIPLKYVIETFPPEVENFCNVYDKHEHIKRHDKLLRVIRLSELFKGHSSKERTQNTGILIVIDNGSRVALLADEVVNIQQVVLKPLKGLHMKKEFFSGGALRGDGYISLVLDIEQLMHEKNLEITNHEGLTIDEP